jgi:hypothetical protein
MGNERTCEKGHRMMRCEVHSGYLVSIPPSKVPHTHCFESWLGDKYWETDERCACELAPVVWDMYRAMPVRSELLEKPVPRRRRRILPKENVDDVDLLAHMSFGDWCLVGILFVFLFLSLDHLFLSGHKTLIL